MSSTAVHRKAADLGKCVLRMTAKSGSGHPSSALSLAQIVTHLMYERMRYDPRDPWNAAADRLVLSEGHAVPIVYAAYADLGGVVGNRESARPLTLADLDGLRDRGSVLDGHPNPAEGFPFFDAATGSLGQGLSVAAGLGLAARLDGSPRRIYALIGDGEAREGQIWEALDFIVDHKLSNICAVFNCNGHGQAGPISTQQSPERLAEKLGGFGWDVRVIDGHDSAAVQTAFDAFGKTARPLAIVARTVKGWGVDTLLDGNWHGKPLSEAQLDAANQSLDRVAAGIAAAGPPLGRPSVPATPASPPQRLNPRNVTWPTFEEVMEQGGFGAALKKNVLGTRKAYGATLKAAGALLPQVVCLDGDVSNSTFAELFAAAYPQRFFECKIAEQNMVSAAAGLAAAGLIPFVNSFAKFIARAYDQVELANISRANIKLVGSHSGITPCSDGPSQMGLLDVAFFRSFTSVRGDDRTSPICWMFQPADAIAAFACTRLMLELDGMCYMRTHRPDVPLLYTPQTRFVPGGLHVLSGGEDLALVSSGYMVYVARQAAELLARQGRRAAVIDAYSLPLDAAALTDALRRCGSRAVVIEDNYGGGLGSAVAEVAAREASIRVRTLHVQRIPKSTRTPEEELEYCGLSAAQVADQAMTLLADAG